MDMCNGNRKSAVKENSGHHCGTNKMMKATKFWEGNSGLDMLMQLSVAFNRRSKNMGETYL